MYSPTNQASGCRARTRDRTSRQNVRRDGVRGVQSPAIGAPREPVVHDVDHVVDDRRLLVVEGHEVAVALEHVVLGLRRRRPASAGRTTAPPGHQHPAGPDRPPGPPGTSGCRVADVVEHAVEQQAHSAVVAAAHQGVEVALVAEAVVDVQVVGRVVAVGLRGEDRSELEPAAPQVMGVVQPVGQVSQPVHHPVGLARLRLGAGEPQGIDVPPRQSVEPQGCHGVESTRQPCGCASRTRP